MLLLGLLFAQPAWARPIAPAELCRTYAGLPGCAADGPACTTCHTAPPIRNSFGAEVEAVLAPGAPRPLDDSAFLLALPEALHAIEADDADGDGHPNLEELLAGSSPGDSASVPDYRTCTPADATAAAREDVDVCKFDPETAFRRVHIDVCGRSATRAELEAFRSAGATVESLGLALDACLTTDHWRGVDGVVWNLANEKILPNASVKSGESPGPIPLADYVDDYNLFVYAQTGDRDVRSLLTASYFVSREPDGTLVPFEVTPEEDYLTRGEGFAQLVPVTRRAGMVTTRWFLMTNTMFTAIPRTTAAQAYRSYLGLDLARMEGLHSVPGEPKDYDAKGVARAECAVCHATLDPLAYPFSRYEGIGGGDESLDSPVGLPFGEPFIPYTYNATRLKRFTPIDGPDVDDAPEGGVLFGVPVADLVTWAGAAAESDAFARKIVTDWWVVLVGRAPAPRDSADVARLTERLRTVHAWRVEAMLHELVLTEAYGAP